MANVIARVKLAPGETGFFDSQANIYLNWNHPVGNVIKGADLKGLRAAVRDKKIIVIEGTLGQKKTFKQILMEAKSKRTGIPLEQLMGDTPLAFEPTEIISDIQGEDLKPVEELPPKEVLVEVNTLKADTPVELDAVVETKAAVKKASIKAVLTEEEPAEKEAPVEDEAKTEEAPAAEEAPAKKKTTRKKTTKKADAEAE